MGCTKNNKVQVHPRLQPKQFVRLNGWTRPIHYLQVIAWFILIFFALMYFGGVAIALDSYWKPAAYVCVGILYAIHFPVHIIAISINPADEGARAQIKGKHSVPDFDRTKHAHVIENEFCHICETYVSKKSKHCRACNKCIEDFDHHCLWLNNCVGKRNYRYFIATISSALIGVVLIIIVSLFVFISAINNFQHLDDNIWWKESWIVMEVFIGIMIVLSIASAFMLVQLLIFHMMLYRRGISTYDHIQKKREKAENKTTHITSVATAGLEEGPDDTNAVACASSADFIDTTVIEKEEEDDSAKMRKYDAFGNSLGSDRSKQENVNSTAIPQSQTFTNEAFTNDEMRNFNTNSNLDSKTLRPLSVHSDVSNGSSLGELKTWDGRESPKTNGHILGNHVPKPDATINDGHSPVSGLGDRLAPDDDDDTLAKEGERKSSVTSIQEDVTSAHRPRHHKHKRHTKKSMMRHREDGAPRPLPILPESPRPTFTLNGSAMVREGQATRLPPLRISADWTSSSEDLKSSLGNGRKLPPLSASSSMNSLVSYATLGSESIVSSHLGEV